MIIGTVNYGHERFILMQYDEKFPLRPLVVEKSEFEKYSDFREKYHHYSLIPNSELINVFQMFQDDKEVWFVDERNKIQERANIIRSAIEQSTPVY